MQQTLYIEGQQKLYWKLITAVTAVLAIVLFLVYWNMQDVFWSGIVRLASFVSFTGAVLSGLKAMEGGLTVEVQTTGNALVLRYLKKSKKVLEEEHKLSDIESVSCIQPSSVLFFQQDNIFIIRFKDSDKNYDLFHFSGQSLKIGSEDTKRLIRFLKGQGIQTSENN